MKKEKKKKEEKKDKATDQRRQNLEHTTHMPELLTCKLHPLPPEPDFLVIMGLA